MFYFKRQTSSWLLKTFYVVLATFFLLTNSVLVYAAESNFWAERQRAAQRVNGRGDGGLNHTDKAPTLLAQLSNNTSLKNVFPGQLNPSQDFSVTSSLTHFLEGQKGDVSPEISHLVSALSGRGVIRDIHLAPREDAPVLLYVQDVHGHKDAQQNIAAMILKSLEINPHAPVGLEGTAGEIDIQGLRGPNSHINHDIGSFFFEQGYIAGPEYAAFSAPETPRFFGLEDKSLYLRHVEAARQSLPKQEAYLDTLNSLRVILESHKKSVYSRTMLDLDQKVRAQEKGTLSLGEYLSALSLSKGVSVLSQYRSFS